MPTSQKESKSSLNRGSVKSAVDAPSGTQRITSSAYSQSGGMKTHTHLHAVSIKVQKAGTTTPSSMSHSQNSARLTKAASSSRIPVSETINVVASEPPVRSISFRPAETSISGREISDKQADEMCRELCLRVWKTDLGKMWDSARAADKKGNVDDQLYGQSLDFFYCFLPMVIKAPATDPVTVSKQGLENYNVLFNRFGDGGTWGQGQSGKNFPHMWFSGPGSEGF
ncbi:uncharacterized protein LY89DRAFT_272178 [Mollisia scopiformis]|uniref:Uncharacterized protein n=1 Tax=Mollisia scopiformis TaxID=149040 RepID=A0A132BED0_MOLSC|nr:uncharacterized protein LY89DRAFT_272178 [Mollisia scopiformis]KUJ10204.1 hypothetical protein LY89DRAFT_272178 [Mollisia scopiformis]